MNSTQYPKKCPFCQAEQTEAVKSPLRPEEENVRLELRSLGLTTDIPPPIPQWQCGTTLTPGLTPLGLAKACALGMDACLYIRSALCRTKAE